MGGTIEFVLKNYRLHSKNVWSQIGAEKFVAFKKKFKQKLQNYFSDSRVVFNFKLVALFCCGVIKLMSNHNTTKYSQMSHSGTIGTEIVFKI